ncbi:MAG: DUF6444 domain-containing protein, partial [Clostridiales bacterium]|nr:DUF6444 domain-containing protein [Clostridiales bacterium]
MGGNYSKGMYNQLMEVMAKLDVLEQEHKQDRKIINELTEEVTFLRKENNELKEEVSLLKRKCEVLEEENIRLKKENAILRKDNKRMKRILNNDSSNSSIPPSKDEMRKAPNTYNSRKPTKKKQGAQKGHKGSGLSKAEVQKKIKDGTYEHRIETIGTPSKK